MQRPPLEVADLVRAAGECFLEKSRGWLRGQHRKVLSAIERCRTAALGGHLDECSDCGHRPAISYNSCRNRHCPKCQANTRERWLQARRKQLLPTRYLHAVFTLPHELSRLTLQNKRVVYSLLLRTSAETLLEVACGFRGKPIGIPGRCRSRFRDEADQRSDAMPITNRAFSES